MNETVHIPNLASQGSGIEKWITLLMQHNETVIEVLFGVVLVVALLVAVRAFVQASKGGSATSQLPLSDLEESLRKILERANQTMPAGAAGAAAASGGAGGELAGEIEKLKIELTNKQAEIESLKNAAGATAAPPTEAISAAGQSELEGKIKELEAKLSEYEIIAEDIADLSVLKEQNAKLQQEVESLKANKAPASDAPAKAAAPAAAAPATSSPPSPAAPAVESAPPAAAPVSADKLVQDAVPAAVAAAPSVSPSPAQAASSSTSPTEVAAPNSPPAVESIAPGVVDDELMKEFASAVEAQSGGASTSASAQAPADEIPKVSGAAAGEVADLDADVNMDKMLSEAGGLDANAAAPAADPLEANLDSDKLLSEASTMEQPALKPEDQQLMGQFEDFVKKGS